MYMNVYRKSMQGDITKYFVLMFPITLDGRTSYGLVVTLCVWWRSQHQTEAPIHGGAHVDVVS